MIKHFASCSPNYPEKVGEPQEVVTPELGDGEHIEQCVDCGAWIVVKDGKVTHVNGHQA